MASRTCRALSLPMAAGLAWGGLDTAPPLHEGESLGPTGSRMGTATLPPHAGPAGDRMRDPLGNRGCHTEALADTCT